MVCPGCGVKRLVQVEVTLQGMLVVMNSCSQCGTSWADASGKPIGLGKVLRIAASKDGSGSPLEPRLGT